MTSNAPTPTNTGDADGPDAAGNEKRAQAKAETRSGREDHATGGKEATAASAKKKKKYKEDTGERPEAPPELRDGAVQRLDLSGGEPAPAASPKDGDGDAAMAEAPAAAAAATVALSEEAMRVAAKYGTVETDGVAERGWVKATSLEDEGAADMLIRVAAERKRGVALMFQPLMSELDKENRPRNQKAASYTNAIKKVLEGVSAIAFLAAAYPEVDESIVKGTIDVWLVSADGEELKEKGSIFRFDYPKDAARHLDVTTGSSETRSRIILGKDRPGTGKSARGASIEKTPKFSRTRASFAALIEKSRSPDRDIIRRARKA